ncbi:3709_t:CDS:10 [Acaulospora colombiana]|uniref:3709_t:CDS:1 n=1 Tax=Acaulospora colombiana TaxID=27376 RepID=A0ACA9JVB0_9GLOM|nr:3709_t:CDS:10 [Acaulospora colombiana]
MATFATNKELNVSTGRDVHLSVSSFSAVSAVEDRDIAPATATTEIFGCFQSLKTLLHPNLCEYVEIVKGKHDRLFVVFEYFDYHTYRVGKLYKRGEDGSLQVSSVGISIIREWAFQILKALAYLNENDITHHNLAPSNIHIDSEGKLKLSDYGLYHMSKGGANVDFPIGYPHYLPPEAIYRSTDKLEATGKVDVWSLGIILAEIHTGSPFWKGNDKDIDKIFSALRQLQSFAEMEEVEVWDHFYIFELGISDAILEFLQGTDDEFRKFVRSCLEVNVSARCSPEQLLSHPFLSPIYERGLSKQHKYWWIKPFLQSQILDIDEIDDDYSLEPQEEPHNKDVLEGIPLSQIYYFWKLAGGDVESELAKRGYLLSTPPIERIPRTVKVLDGKEEGTTNDTAFLYSDTNYNLSLEELRQRLEMATGPNKETFVDTEYFLAGDEDDMNFLADEMSDEDNSNSDALPEKYLFPDLNNKTNSTTNGTNHSPNNVKLPLLIREKDVGYQFQRVALFSELLRQYPSSRDEIIHHAKVDIPPFLRGKIWAAILGISGDYQAVYDSYDKESEKETDRQILVGPPSLPLFAGISILRQLRDSLINSEFNDCIMIFSESFPDVDIEKCIQSALSMFKVTPPSVYYRVHEPRAASDKPSNYENQNHTAQRWWEQPTPIETKKIELAPRISLKDLVKLKNHVLVIDTRSEQEFARGHFPLSVNMNSAHLEQFSPTLLQEKKKYHVVVGKRGDSGPQFAADLVNANFPRVAVLTGGIDVMRVEEGVVVCACRPTKVLVTKNKDGKDNANVDESSLSIDRIFAFLE